MLCIHNKNADRWWTQTDGHTPDRSARLTVLLKAASVLKSTVAGKLFRTFTILLATKFVLALLVFCDLYSLYA